MAKPVIKADIPLDVAEAINLLCGAFQDEPDDVGKAVETILPWLAQLPLEENAE